MQAPLEIRYAGIVVGRPQEIRDDEDATFFLPGKEPMPVGTVVQLRSGDQETPARVLRAVESSDPAVAGMKVRLIGEAETVLPDWIPTPAAAAGKAAKVGTPTLAKESDLGLMQTEMPKAPAVLEAATPVAPPEPAPVPEAVPVAVGSSLTGALEKVAEASPDAGTTVPAEAAPASPEQESNTEEAPTLPTAKATTAEAAPAEAAAPPGANPAAASETGPAAEEMPVARPIAGPSGRRKTKRRR